MHQPAAAATATARLTKAGSHGSTASEASDTETVNARFQSGSDLCILHCRRPGLRRD